MRFAISIPDATFERASARAASLGMSRSEFFSKAAERYLADLDQERLVDQIDAALEAAGGGNGSVDDSVESGHRSLRAVDDEW